MTLQTTQSILFQFLICKTSKYKFSRKILAKIKKKKKKTGQL